MVEAGCSDRSHHTLPCFYARRGEIHAYMQYHATTKTSGESEYTTNFMTLDQCYMKRS